MPAVLTQMGGYSIGTGFESHLCRTKRIRESAAACIPNGRHMVDVDPET